jgi:hypothetical protein
MKLLVYGFFFFFFLFFCLLVLLCFIQLNSNYLGFRLFVCVRDPLFAIFFYMSTQKKGEVGFKLVTSRFMRCGPQLIELPLETFPLFFSFLVCSVSVEIGLDLSCYLLVYLVSLDTGLDLSFRSFCILDSFIHHIGSRPSKICIPT